MNKEIHMTPTVKIRWREANSEDFDKGNPFSKMIQGFYESEYILEQWWQHNTKPTEGEWIPIEVEK